MKAIAAVFCALLSSGLVAQSPARLDAAKITSGYFAAERFGPVRWLDGGHYATLEPNADKAGVSELVRYEAVTGKRQPMVTVAMLWVADEARALMIEDYAFSPDNEWLLVFCDSARVWRRNTRGNYYVLPLDGSREPKRLGGDLPESSLMFAKFSPSGDRVAYVAERDLYVERVADGKRTRLTDSGSATIINGTFDWVYEEEFDCRDGFRWSPDGTRIAYWQLDCEGVGTFYMMDNLSDRYSRVVPVQYPKAGTTNSACRVGVIPAKGGETVWIETPGDPRETYVPRMEWHPAGEELMVQWLPRKQSRLVIYGADAATGKVRVVHEEQDDAYVDVRNDFRWARTGQYLHVADSPHRHAMVMRWRPWPPASSGDEAKFVARVETAWLGPAASDLMSIDYVDLDRGKLYGSACDGNATQKFLFDFDPEPVRLTPDEQPGWHDYQPSPDASLAIHTYSRFGVPPVIDLVRLPSHERVRVLVDNRRLRMRYDAVQKGGHEFFEVTTADGHSLDGWILYPLEFDEAKRWPDRLPRLR